MKIIKLTKGHEAIVDDEDFDRVSKINWHTMPHGRNFYARGSVYDSDAYHRGEKFQHHRLLHRVILGVDDPKTRIDHIDGDGLNNQKSNLRICTHAQNMMNRKKNKNGFSKFKGVAYRNRPGHAITWDANIGLNGKRKHIGCFQTETEAALAYNFMAAHHFGEFARLNKIY